MKFDERNPIFFKSPLFVSMATAAKFVQPIPIFLAYLVQLDGAACLTPCKYPFPLKSFNFLHLGNHGNGRHFEFVQLLKSCHHTTVDIPTKFHEV